MPRHNLYMFRCEKKLTKGEMAKRTGVCRTTYAHIENGERDGSAKFWDNLQAVFSLSDGETRALQKKDVTEV